MPIHNQCTQKAGQLIHRHPVDAGAVTTPADVQVHTSNPAVELLYALYFHLT